MASISSYKCPNCNASIPFDATSGQLKCAHCGTEYSIENLEAYNVEQNLKTDVADWNIQDAKIVPVNGKISYVCPSCSGEVTGDENMTATACPYCGTPIVVGEQLTGVLEPELIIPFKLTRNDAEKAYQKFISDKKLLPDDFKIKNFIEKLQGIYVPYWLFDGDASGQARYRTTRTRVHDEGDWRVTMTEHYLVYRDGDASFVKVPVDASTKLDDALLDSIEPFDYNEGKTFNNAYLSSFLADKYGQDKDVTVNKANERIRNSISMLLADSVTGYDSILPEACSIQVKNGKAIYALLPVYVFSTKYQGKVYQFAMNGQTGKFTGDLPMDKSKALKTSLITFAISFAVIFVIFFVLNGGLG